VESGANPQTTASYDDPNDGPAVDVVLTSNLSGAQLWRYVCWRRSKPAGIWRRSAPALLSLVLSSAA